MEYDPAHVIELLGGPTKAADRLNVAAGIPETAPKRLTRYAISMWRSRGSVPHRWRPVVAQLLIDKARAA